MSRLSQLKILNSDGLKLEAVLVEPDSKPQAYALYAHCFTCTKEIAAAVRIAGELAAYGVAVLRFDFAGLGASEGDFLHQTFSKNVSDVVHAARTMEEHNWTPRLLIGHSLGGAAVLAAAGEIDSVRAVAAIGAPSEPGHIQRLFDGEVDKIRLSGAANVRLAGRDVTMTRQFVDDAATYDLSQKLSKLNAALLILHAPEDRVVEIGEAAKIYRAARHPKSFVALAGADHLLTRRTDTAYAARVIAAWSSLYVA
jgi:putative redox protein